MMTEGQGAGDRGQPRGRGQETGGGGLPSCPRPLPLTPCPLPRPASQEVLVISLSNIGDAILTLPVLDLVRQRHAAARITVLCGARAAAIFAGRLDVADLLVEERRAPWRATWALWRRLRRQRFALVIDLRHTLWPLLLRAQRRSPLARQPPRRLIHMRDRHLWRAQQALDTTDLPAARRHAPSADDALFATRWLAQAGVPVGAALVAISPGARSHIKRWTSDGFAAVADRLIAEEHCHVLVLGEAAEAELARAVVARMRQRAVHVAAGQTTLPQAAALLAHCRLLLTNDSATMHLAGYVGVPVVAIFGPTDPHKYGPRGLRDQIVQRRLHCVPCEASLCRYHHECMNETSPDDVLAAARAVLRAVGADPADAAGS